MIKCCWCAEAWTPFPGCIFGKKLSQTRNCWSWWRRLGPLWSAWAESLVKTQQKGGVSTWVGVSWRLTLPTIPTCKQGSDAVLCHDPVHHTDGGVGKLAGHWEQRANSQCYGAPDPQTIQMSPLMITFLCMLLPQFNLPSCFDNIEW